MILFILQEELRQVNSQAIDLVLESVKESRVCLLPKNLDILLLQNVVIRIATKTLSINQSVFIHILFDLLEKRRREGVSHLVFL